MQENTKKILSINERIIYILEYYGVSRYKFSQETGISETVLLNIYKGKNKPSADFIEKLLNRYKVINGNWLMTGDGDMLKSEDTKKNIVDGEPPPCQWCVEKERIIAALQDSLKTKDIALNSLVDQIELLKNHIFEAHQEKPGEQKRKAS